MSAPDPVHALHDRATRQMSLSAAEHAQLAAWYADQDAAERQLLALSPPASSLDDLTAQVEAAVAYLLTLARHIQELTGQNAALRHEIAALQRQMAPATTDQPA